MTELNRRALLVASAAAFAGASSPAFAAWPEAGHGMPMEGADTPHICLGPIADSEINPAGIRRYTQIGLTHIIVNGSGYPWDAGMLKAKVKTLADNGLVAGDIGLPWTGAAGSGMRDICGRLRQRPAPDARHYLCAPGPRQGDRGCEDIHPRGQRRGHSHRRI